MPGEALINLKIELPSAAVATSTNVPVSSMPEDFLAGITAHRSKRIRRNLVVLAGTNGLPTISDEEVGQITSPIHQI